MANPRCWHSGQRFIIFIAQNGWKTIRTFPKWGKREIFSFRFAENEHFHMMGYGVGWEGITYFLSNVSNYILGEYLLYLSMILPTGPLGRYPKLPLSPPQRKKFLEY